MTWTQISEAEMAMARHVVTWIRTARAAGYGGPDWLPNDVDCHKSALLERLRSGKDPLPEPPPLGMACPWYALIEDAGPHYVFDVWRGDASSQFVPRDTLVALQSLYKIETEKSETDFIVRDARHETSYRFRLWYNPEWIHPSNRLGRGGWFMQNVALAAPQSTEDAA